MNILLTGISGFAGTNLVKHFSKLQGITLFGHSRNLTETQQKLKDFKVELVPSYSAEVFNNLQIDCIIHLAGIAHDLSNKYVPSDYYEVNDKQTRKIYDDFLKSNAKKFIFLSSIKSAVDIASKPADETITPSPVSDYGKSKLQAEQYIQQQILPVGKHYYIFRPCMIHGPGNKGNLNLLYKFVKSRIPYPLAAFKNQRSFLNVDNFNFITTEFATRNLPSGVYHLADNGYLSTTELYKIIAEALHIKPITIPLPAPFIKAGFTTIGKSRMLHKLTEDMMVSNEKVIKTIGKPLPVSIDEGIRNTVRSF